MFSKIWSRTHSHTHDTQRCVCNTDFFLHTHTLSLTFPLFFFCFVCRYKIRRFLHNQNSTGELCVGRNHEMTSSPKLEGRLRDSVVEQVDACLWLEDLKKKYDEIGTSSGGASGVSRCVVCSLPVGTCPHDTQWMNKMAPWQKGMKSEETADESIRDVLDVLGAGSVVHAIAEPSEEFNFSEMQWCRHTPYITDKIGADRVQVSFPGIRGFHSVVRVGEHVVVFGGFQYKANEVPQPFSASITPGDVKCLGDVYLYNIVRTSWHKIFTEHGPEPRYGKSCCRDEYFYLQLLILSCPGHSCAALDDNRMIMFGGRNQNGKFLSDTWFFDVSTCTWTELPEEPLSPPPTPRAFSALCSIYNDSVLLFGGTDGIQNFGDVWIFRGEPTEWRWERGVTVSQPFLFVVARVCVCACVCVCVCVCADIIVRVVFFFFRPVCRRSPATGTHWWPCTPPTSARASGCQVLRAERGPSWTCWSWGAAPSTRSAR
jgi:hypothetical protein